MLWAKSWLDLQARHSIRTLMDNAYYLAANQDVAAARILPTVHFIFQGYLESRNPSPGFAVDSYLARYPDVYRSGINPLLHYALFGRREQRFSAADPLAVVAGNVRAVAAFGAQKEMSSYQTPAALYMNNAWPADRPLVTVIIVCFNYGKYVREALASVLDQTFQDFEVIVVEGGSTDPDTIAEVRRLEPDAPPNVRILYRSESHLVGDNRNFGIREARGRYIVCLDADDKLKPAYLEIAVFLAETCGYDLVYPSIQAFGASDLRWNVVDATLPVLMRENQVSTIALFRKSVWAHIGGFRDWGLGEAYVPEDWELWLRMIAHGFRPKSISSALMLYRVHAGSLSSGCRLGTVRQREQIQEANQELLNNFAPPPPTVSILNREINLFRDCAPAPRPGVLLALPFVTIGGAEKLIATVANGLVRAGRSIVVTTSIALPPSMPENFQLFEPLTTHIYNLPSLFDDPRLWREFYLYLLRAKNIDTVFMAGSEFVYHLLPEIRSMFPAVRVIDQLFNEVVHVYNNRRYSEYIDTTVVPSQALADCLIKDHGADQQRIRVIPHGVEVSEEECARATQLPPQFRGKFVVGFFGRLSSEKAPKLFVEIARLLRAVDDVCFIMTGEGPERETVMDLIRHYRLSSRFYAPGFVESAAPLMRAADVMVLPSTIDGMPLAVIEAQLLGKPVIASRVGSLPSMVLDGETGFLCDIGDVDAFADRILRLRRDPALRSQMAERAAQHACQNFGAGRMIAQYEAVMFGDGEAAVEQ